MKRLMALLIVLLALTFATSVMATPIYFTFTDGSGDSYFSGNLVNLNYGSDSYFLVFEPISSGSFTGASIAPGIDDTDFVLIPGTYDIILYEGSIVSGRTSTGDAEWTLVPDDPTRLTLNWNTVPVVNVITTNDDVIEATSVGADNPVPLPGTLVLALSGLFSAALVLSGRKEN